MTWWIAAGRVPAIAGTAGTSQCPVATTTTRVRQAPRLVSTA
ncbi:hypothetical protein ACFQU2_09045 [Siccirubricoccus deserti]